MKGTDFKILGWAFLACSVCWALHELVLRLLFATEAAHLVIPLDTLYLFFGSCCVLMTLVSVLVHHFSIHSVGQSFLLMSFIEILLCFALYYRDLTTVDGGMGFEKSNFIVTFLLFLAIETVLTIRLLNKKQ